MARENWFEQLEAYLDGELDVADAATFEAEIQADPTKQKELAERRRFRDLARRALCGGVPTSLIDSLREAATAAPTPATRSGRRRVRRYGWPAFAVAAALALLLVLPRASRRSSTAVNPLSDSLHAGQVVALRFGERPGTTVLLKAGTYDLSNDLVN